MCECDDITVLSGSPAWRRWASRCKVPERCRVPERRPAAPRWAVAVVFFAFGAAAGTWAARVPAMKAELHLSAGALGLVLLGPAIGSMLAMPATGAILGAVAPRRVAQFGLLPVAGMLPLATFTDTAWQLFAVLACWGVGIGSTDVAMNIEAAAVQEHLGRTTMSAFHAAYSAGGLAGAGAGAIAAAAGLSARVNFALAALVVVSAGVGCAQLFASRPAAHGPRHQPGSRWPAWSWTLVCLALVAFGSFLAEGAASDWSAVYLHSSLGASPGLAGVAYTLFSCAMLGGRLAGDRLTDWAGPARLLRVSAGLACVCFLAALLIGRPAAGLAGFTVLGAGLAVVVPVVFTAASRLGLPGPNLALVTSTGYTGMLVGPAVIGGLAEVVGLPAALGTIVAVTAMTAIMAGAVRSQPAPAASPVASQVSREP
jgi:predicted MFS family arabinose efflux permease